MRTLLTEIQQIDDHCHDRLPGDESALFSAKLILYPQLREDVALHKQTLTLVKRHGREGLLAQIKAVHQQLFTEPQHQGFRQRVLRLFNR